MGRRRLVLLAIFSVGLITPAALATQQLQARPENLPVPPAPIDVPNEPLVTSASSAGEQLAGVFEIDRGECAGGPITAGSYFRMVTKAGNPQNGPFVANNDSSCGDKTFTPFVPGSDGGLSTAGYQPHPSPAFDALGGGENSRITQPAKFFGVDFSTATNQKDPQTGAEVAAPKVIHDGSGKLSGDVRSFAAAWNRQHFNQGAPKPDGSTPGHTAAPSGTYSAATKSYSLEWRSFIVSGPFDGFTGIWHLEGTFRPSAAAQQPQRQPAGPAPRPANPAPRPAEPAPNAAVIPKTGGSSGPLVAVALALIAAGSAAELYGRTRPAPRRG